MTKSKYEKDYLEADKYVVVNDNDPDLTPIVLSLPKPPQLYLIDGYGLPIEEQRFNRMEIPRRLVDLEAEAVDETKKQLSSNKNNVVTLLKIQKTFWDLLYSRHKDYKKEINFIRRFWWHRVHGFWTFIYGKPYYITGQYFFYLNLHTMNTKDGTGRPEFRMRDWKEYIFEKYCMESTETFERIDEEGYAIKEEDGTYATIDVGDRVCFGKMQPKHRRSGNTNKAISNMIEIVSRSRRNFGGGIQSFSNQNAKETFDTLLMPCFDSYPIWIKPNTTSGRTSDSLKFNVGKNEYGEPSLQTQITYATTASEKFYDSKKMMYLLVEEAGKTDEVDVAERHEVTKHTLSQAGTLLHGYCSYPSTVSETSEGAAYYRALSNTSNFYRRLPSGQTFSGLFRLFIPADDGNDKYIDPYGRSVKGELTKEHRDFGFKKTATQEIIAKRDAYIKDGGSESNRLLRNEKKLFPMKYEDCWLGEAGDIGFNMENIDSQLAELRRNNRVIKGRLEWINGIYMGNVEFVPDEEMGRFELSERPREDVSNKKTKGFYFSTFEGQDVEMYEPDVKGKYVVGADPFRFGNKQDERIGKSLNKNSRLSDGGIAVFMVYDEAVDGGKQINEWNTHRFVMSYRYRPSNTDEYCEDVLKAAVYYGAYVYPETNVPSVYEYFIRHKIGGYLLYDVDKFTGQYKKKPGVDSLERSKQDLFAMLRDYIEKHCHREDFASFLNECKTIRGMEQMRHFDRLTAHGMCLLGAKSTFLDDVKNMGKSSNDISDYLDLFDIGG